jgi:hypothetical protein
MELSDREAQQIVLALKNRQSILTTIMNSTEGEGFLRSFTKDGRTNAKCKHQLKIVNDLLNRMETK